MLTTPKPEITDSLRTGVYANFFGVSASEREVVLDFGLVSPEPGTTEGQRNVIVSRVIMTKYAAELLSGLLAKTLGRSS